MACRPAGVTDRPHGLNGTRRRDVRPSARTVETGYRRSGECGCWSQRPVTSFWRAPSMNPVSEAAPRPASVPIAADPVGAAGRAAASRRPRSPS